MTLPVAVARDLRQAYPEFQIVAAFRADISMDGAFAGIWVAAGRSGVVLLQDRQITLVPRAEIEFLVTHRYVSSGRLSVCHAGATRLLVRYSAARLEAVEVFVHTVNQALRLPATDAEVQAEAELPPRQSSSTMDPGDDDSPEEYGGKSVLWRLYHLLPASKWWRLPLIALALLAGAAAAVLSPLLAGCFFFDEVLAPEGRYSRMLLGAVGLMLLSRVAEVGFRIAWGLINASLTHDLEITLKRTAFASLQRLSLRFFMGHHTGELMVRLEQDASDIALMFHIIAPSAIHGDIFLAGSLATML